MEKPPSTRCFRGAALHALAPAAKPLPPRKQRRQVIRPPGLCLLCRVVTANQGGVCGACLDRAVELVPASVAP